MELQRQEEQYQIEDSSRTNATLRSSWASQTANNLAAFRINSDTLKLSACPAESTSKMSMSHVPTAPPSLKFTATFLPRGRLQLQRKAKRPPSSVSFWAGNSAWRVQHSSCSPTIMVCTAFRTPFNRQEPMLPLSDALVRHSVHHESQAAMLASDSKGYPRQTHKAERYHSKLNGDIGNAPPTTLSASIQRYGSTEPSLRESIFP